MQPKTRIDLIKKVKLYMCKYICLSFNIYEK
jgi:hypothetical protein